MERRCIVIPRCCCPALIKSRLKATELLRCFDEGRFTVTAPQNIPLHLAACRRGASVAAEDGQWCCRSCPARLSTRLLGYSRRCLFSSKEA